MFESSKWLDEKSKKNYIINSEAKKKNCQVKLSPLPSEGRFKFFD